jgi:RNA polymerase sigma-70 factor (ECF subfamily)
MNTVIDSMAQIPQLKDPRILLPSETAVALNLIGRMDLLRLKAIARLHARGLPPDVTWDDLLQEAFTRVLVGSRRKPPDVAMVPFLAGIMRSLRSQHWQRAWRKGGSSATLRIDHAGDLSRDTALCDAAADPEQSLIAQEQLEAIHALFVGDPIVLRIIAGLAEGRSAAQIRAAMNISKTDYDSARKRMRRALLREGLTCIQG